MVIEKSCCLLLLAFVASCCELLGEYELSRMKRLLGLTIVLLVWPLLNNISAIRWFQILPRKKGFMSKNKLFDNVTKEQISSAKKVSFGFKIKPSLNFQLVDTDWLMLLTNQMTTNNQL